MGRSNVKAALQNAKQNCYIHGIFISPERLRISSEACGREEGKGDRRRREFHYIETFPRRYEHLIDPYISFTHSSNIKH